MMTRLNATLLSGKPPSPAKKGRMYVISKWLFILSFSVRCGLFSANWKQRSSFPHAHRTEVPGNDLSSDASKVVEIIAHRNTEELKFVRQTYGTLYSQDLLHLLSQKSDLFARVVYLRVSEPHHRDAEIIRGALVSRCLDLNILTEIICTRSSTELRIVKEVYQSRYNTDLMQDVSYKISGILKEILVAVLTSSRYVGARLDTSMAMCDAKTFYEAIASGQYVDQKSIVSILSQRSTNQIKAILSSYKQLYGYEFMKFLKKDKCGDFGKQLRVVIRCIQSPEKQFAKQLRRALKTGDAQEALIRTVATRADIDLRQINGSFTTKTGWSLESLVRNEFSNRSSSSSDRVSDLTVLGRSLTVTETEAKSSPGLCLPKITSVIATPPDSPG